MALAQMNTMSNKKQIDGWERIGIRNLVPGNTFMFDFGSSVFFAVAIDYDQALKIYQLTFLMTRYSTTTLLSSYYAGNQRVWRCLKYDELEHT